MKRFFALLILVTMGVATFMFFRSNCLPEESIPVDGFLFGRSFKTTVDHRLAKLMLTDPQDQSVVSFVNTYKDRPLNTATLAEITTEFSPDVATLYFLQRAYQETENKRAQDLYRQYFERQLSGDAAGELAELKKFHVVFVPGLAYLEDPTTGADLSRQRRLLTSYGITNELIKTGEWDLVEKNARLIADRLREISKSQERILLVSASKGGLETAIAIGRILKPEETGGIKAWVSVGGILKGSPIADDYLTEPKCWLAQFMLWTRGKGINIVQDISYERRKLDFESLNIPKNIKTIHFVGAPLASKIGDEIKSRYCSLLKYGPNDGLTPLADEVTKNGMIVSEIGLDHYYRDPEIDKKTLALALAAVSIQQKSPNH